MNDGRFTEVIPGVGTIVFDLVTTQHHDGTSSQQATGFRYAEGGRIPFALLQIATRVVRDRYQTRP